MCEWPGTLTKGNQLFRVSCQKYRPNEWATQRDSEGLLSRSMAFTQVWWCLRPRVWLFLWLLCLKTQNTHCKAKLVGADVGEGGKQTDGGVFFSVRGDFSKQLTHPVLSVVAWRYEKVMRIILIFPARQCGCDLITVLDPDPEEHRHRLPREKEKLRKERVGKGKRIREKARKNWGTGIFQHWFLIIQLGK